MYLLFSLVFENSDLFPKHILISETFKRGKQIRTLGAAQTATGRDPSYWFGWSAAQEGEMDLPVLDND
jgi:hypothetical protein